MDGLEFLLLLVGGFIATIVVLLVVTLRRPLLAVTPVPPEAALRDLAYRLRASGHTVTETPTRLEIPVGSVAALKVHARATPRGTELRYEVDATGLGWTIVLILAGFGGAGFVAIAVAAYIHIAASRFARQWVAPLLAAAPLGTPPPPTVRTLLIEGLSEARRLASEAADYEREASQNAIGLVVLASMILFAVFFGFLATVAFPGAPGGLAVAAGLSLAISAMIGGFGSWWIQRRADPRVRSLEQESALFSAALAAETIGYPVPGGPRPGLELLLRAAERSPHWREIRRARKLVHEPVAGFVVFLLAYGAAMFLGLALAEFLPPEVRAGLGLLGAGFALGAVWSVRSWRKRVREEDERDRRSWEFRRAAIETELWRILSG